MLPFLLVSVMSAPARSSSATMASWPCRAAHIKAVYVLLSRSTFSRSGTYWLRRRAISSACTDITAPTRPPLPCSLRSHVSLIGCSLSVAPSTCELSLQSREIVRLAGDFDIIFNQRTFNMVSQDEEERFAQLCEQIRRECFADARDADQVRALAGNHTILSLYVPCWQSIQLSPCSWHHSVLTFQSLHALIVGYARTRRRRRHRSPTLCSVHCESNSKLHQQPPSKWSGRGTVRMPCLRACEINPDIPRITGGVFRCCRRTLSTPKRVRSFSFRSPR